MTKRECAIIMAYTGICTLEGKDLGYYYNYISKLIPDNVIYTNQYVNVNINTNINDDTCIYTKELESEIKHRSKNDFMKLCKEATDG